MKPKKKAPLFTFSQLASFDLDYLLDQARKRRQAESCLDERPLLAFSVTERRITIWPGHYGTEEEARIAARDLRVIYRLPVRLSPGDAPEIVLRPDHEQLPLALPTPKRKGKSS